jgi:spore coat polysaccharide biosynthesis protein SpsF (cytidylyltransferase family)
MKIAAIIQARMGSTRLPNKVMMPVMGKPLLGWMLDRIASCIEIDEVIVATTLDVRDNVIAQFVESVKCRVYRGSERDVLDRYYKAACLVQPDAVVRITADCPLLDPNVLDSMIRSFKVSDLDFLSNSEPLPSSWPDGMDISIIGFNALQKAWQCAFKPSDREHVTFHFWRNPSIFNCKTIHHEPDWSRYRITIDYPEDFELIKSIIEHFGAIGPAKVKNTTMEEIINFLELNPTVFKLNEKYTRGIGWKPALEKDKQLGYS